MSDQKDFRLGNSPSRNETFNDEYIQEIFVISYHFAGLFAFARIPCKLVEAKRKSRLRGCGEFYFSEAV
jgi:hypothetical protein